MGLGFSAGRLVSGDRLVSTTEGSEDDYFSGRCLGQAAPLVTVMTLTVAPFHALALVMLFFR
jgi:hypothetical protein